MALGFMVPGPTLVKTGTGAGGTPALESLGLTEDGVRVQVTFSQRPVKSDAAGPDEPADFQRFGSSAVIRCRLANYDDTILMKLIALADGNATEGVLGGLGGLIGAGGAAYRLVLSNANKVYRFTTVTLANAAEIVLSTKYATPDIVFKAWRYLPGTAVTANGVLLYDHTDA